MRFLLGALTATGIFLIDTFTMLQSSVATLYILVLVAIGDLVTSRAISSAAAACAGLTLVSFGMNHGMDPGAGALLRLVVSVTAIVLAAALIARGNTLRLSTAKALRASEAKYRDIFDTLAVAIWEHDFRAVKAEIQALRAGGVTDLRSYLVDHPEFVIKTRRMVQITDANETALRLLHIPTKEQFFSNLAGFLPETDESFAECLIALDEGWPIFESKAQVRTATGNPVDIIVALTFPPGGRGLDRIYGSILDITERKRIEGVLDRTRAELDRATRAAAGSELSATLAHEINQPLSAVRTYTDAAGRWLSRRPPNIDEALDAVNHAADAAAKAGEIITRVRRFLSKSAHERTPMTVDLVIRSGVDLVQGQIAATATTLVLNLRAGAARVCGDKALVQQLLLNLIDNALQAMDQHGAEQPRLLVETRCESGSVYVTVSDNGPGFAREACDRAFEAFFTTREGSMGLGLTMCRSIAERHDGSIRIDRSRLERGAAVEVRLPALPAE
ncbi:hypothetical protein BK022_11720 [Methylorubrum extorquens]|uniref:histidine kinase n=1 Tax=Methylorubrum extorquens TaxID=408 RepID=A0A1S1P7C2_METEX|nr:hypothetical protein BK022_11720 [Methylorubrum extorquens]